MTDSAVALVDEPESPAHAAPARRLALNVTFLAGSQVITWSSTLLWTLIVPRILGPSGMGRMVTALAASGVLGVAIGLGTRTYLVRAMASSPRQSASLTGTAIALRLCLAVPGIVVMALFVRVARFDVGETVIVGLATAGMLLSVLAEPIQASFQARERMEYIAYAGVFNTVALSLGGIAVVLIGFRATGLMAWSLVLSAVVLALNLRWVRTYHGIEWRTSLDRLRRLLRDSLAYAASSFFGMVYVWVSSIMLAALTPATTVGWYGASNRLFTTLMFVPTIVATAWLPRLVMAHEKGIDRFHVAARAPVELVVILSLPIAAGTALTAVGVVGTLYGPAFGPAAPVLMILAACCVPMYFNIIAYQVMVARNRPGVWNQVMVAATVVHVILNLIAIQYFQRHFANGAIGGALGLLTTELFISCVGIALLRKTLTNGTLVRVLKAAAATVGMSAAVLIAAPLGFVAQAFVGVIVFSAFAALLRLPTEEEWAGLRHLLSRGVAQIRRRPLAAYRRRS